MRADRDRYIALAWTAIAVAALTASVLYMRRNYDAADPVFLWALVPLVVIALLIPWLVRQRSRSITLPTLGMFRQLPLDVPTLLRPMPRAAMYVGLGLMLVAMARPQSKDQWKDVKREGIDIMIAMDVSGSMLAKDLKPDRLTAAKRMGAQFVDARPNDRIGLVVYEAEAFTQCPLTTDHTMLKELFSSTRSGLIDGGTAIGMGLATALNRLRDSEAKSKVVILLTDGVNNAGMVQPLDAAQIAESLGVRVYTIGVGTRGKALYPVDRYPNGQIRYEYMDVEIDEEVLKRIAKSTGGTYFRATDERKLADIYAQIDELEKTRIKVTEHSTRNEEYPPFLLFGLVALCGGWILERTWLKSMA